MQSNSSTGTCQHHFPSCKRMSKIYCKECWCCAVNIDEIVSPCLMLCFMHACSCLLLCGPRGTGEVIPSYPIALRVFFGHAKRDPSEQI